jgi:alpha-1,2-mannosyltransferase
MSNLKKVYYVLLTYVYSFCGWSSADQIATNSSWTDNHILQLWRRPKQTQIMYVIQSLLFCSYPPVDTTDLKRDIPDLSAPRRNLMISFAQFRPEKDQAMQLRIWKKILPKIPRDSKFWLLGTVRDEDDQRILD